MRNIKKPEIMVARKSIINHAFLRKAPQKLSIIFALFAMFAFTMFGYAVFQSNYGNPIPKLDLLTPNYYLYSNGTLICQTSQELYASVAIIRLCTDTFTSTSTNSNATPYSISLFYYTFGSQSNASSYVGSVIELLNTTPWPNNIVAFGQIQKYNNIKIYETTMVIHGPTNYTRVNTIYAQINNKIIGVSSLSSSSSSFVSAENFDEQLLYNWYLLPNNNTA